MSYNLNQALYEISKYHSSALDAKPHKCISWYRHTCLDMSVIRINLEIDDELDEQFRNEVAKRLGMRKGNIKIAVEQAFRLWIGQKE